MEATDKKAPTPPYVPYKTLRNFLDKFQHGVPGRIDRGLMGTMSGALQSQVTTALKYLRLISDAGIPSDSMKRLVMAEGEDRKSILKNVLMEGYPFIFREGFDFSSATASQLREEFEEKTTASGETVRRCMAFLKDAAQEAGISVSPYITQKAGRGASQRMKRNSTSRKSDHELPPTRETTEPPPQSHSKHLPIEAQGSLLLWGLFQRLPKPGSVWPRAERDRWTETLNNVLSLEYKDQ
jgi:hypothetical protein